MTTIRYGAIGLLVGGLLCGCGSDGNTATTGSFNNSNSAAVLARVNRVELIDPTPNSPDDPALLSIRAFDSQGNLVFGPIERPYSPNLLVAGFSEDTSEVVVDHQRASGFVTRSVRHAVNFRKDDDGLVQFQSHSPLAVAAPRNAFTIKVVNNSAYTDDKVFVSVSGKDRNDTAFYYLKFGANGSAQSLPFGPVSGFADYSAPLTSLLKEEAPHTYSFQCPYENLVSGRIYVSFGKKLEGYGLNNLADKKSLQTPSASGAPDYLTLYEFMELSATTQPQAPLDYTLYANTSVVDFFSIGLGMSLAYQDGGSETVKTVGFVDNARNLLLQEFAKPSTPDVFKRYIRNQDQSKILRVLGPNQSVALDGENSPIGQFLQPALDSGWVRYASVVLNIPDNLPANTFFYQYTGQLIGGLERLNMTLTAKPPGDSGSPIGEQYSLPKPTSKIVFFCDDVLNGRPVNETYANLGTEAHKRLVSLIGAALNRGVFENYTDWGNSAAFYTRPDGKYNWYAKIMHQFALEGKVYGFGYDDVYGQDPTLVRKLDDVNRLVITIPPVEKLTND